MPPRLPTLTALRGSAQSLSKRFITTTKASAADPPSTQTHHNKPRSSSSDSLMSLNRKSGPNGQRHASPYGPNERRAARHKPVDTARRILDRYKGASRSAADAAAQLREQKLSNEYLREMPRKWEAGDVYAPHDLSPAEMAKFRRRAPPKHDVVDLLGLEPKDMYKNFSMIAEYTTGTGQILNSTKTGLRPVNQRKMAKMVRRAQGMGIYPSVHDHPELLRGQFFPGYRGM